MFSKVSPNISIIVKNIFVKKIFYSNIMKDVCFFFQIFVIRQGIKIVYIFQWKVDIVLDILVISCNSSKPLGIANVFKLCIDQSNRDRDKDFTAVNNSIITIILIQCIIQFWIPFFKNLKQFRKFIENLENRIPLWIGNIIPWCLLQNCFINVCINN